MRDRRTHHVLTICSHVIVGQSHWKDLRHAQSTSNMIHLMYKIMANDGCRIPLLESIRFEIVVLRLWTLGMQLTSRYRSI
jgi:hypothetical protein